MTEPNEPWRQWTPPNPNAPHLQPPVQPAPPAPEPAAERRGRWTFGRRIAAVGAAALVAVGSGAAGAAVALSATGDGTVYSSPTAVSGASTTGGSTAQVAAAVSPSVVSVATQTGSGSGVIIRSDGVIMTNAHVVSGASAVTVKFSNGKTARATVVGSDTSHDIAVLKASGVSGLKPVTFGNSDGLAVGDAVLAIGSPLGLDGSVTSGIVSALGREIKESDEQDQQLPSFLRGQTPQEQTVIRNAIQTDAAINPGNSGGALVNAAGQLVGINTAIATSGGSSSGNIGVGFAISSNTARSAAAKIISAGSV
ncbi:putative serine protease HtrA [Actinomadura rubteroloni]|uniref:Putative serine protease HtrA n=1 Tax=Actinomadura rubteroloni TaxID=1926885 RepID=A0A2P4UNZ7_9ACTN|nr:trypsin-like peptidase domain-containing protein [Actinomadura rubteroloni]POM26780.1 putative serine protease HtrA [Actinomadura rubteroloni]